MSVLATADLPDRVLDRVRAQFPVTRGSLADAASVRPDVILCSIWPDRFSAEVIAALPDSVRVIATYSVGHDHIDLAAASARGIIVLNTPDVLSDAVAEVAMLLMLGAARRATESIALLREGRWSGWTPRQLIGVGLSGKTLGILGMGQIGCRVAGRARAFGMEIAYHNRRAVAGNVGRFELDARELVAKSDFLLLAWPSTVDTRRFIARETLDRAKPSMILINIGRGDLIDDEAVIQALRDRRIAAVGLDVFDGEPAINPGYLDLPNAFLLPHIGSSTWEARIAMADALVDGIARHAAGNEPTNRIA